MRNDNTIRLFFLIFIAAGVVFQTQIFNYTFFWDDWHWLNYALQNNFDFRKSLSNEIDGYFRPLTHIYFMANMKYFGLNIIPYRLISLLIHVFNTYLVFLVTRTLNIKKYIAYISAGLFMVCATTAFAYYWSSAITDLLTTMGILLSLFIWHKYDISDNIIYLILSLLSWTLTVVSKETGFFLLPVFFAYDYATTYQKEYHFSKSMKKFIPFLLIVVIYIVLRIFQFSSMYQTHGGFKGIIPYALFWINSLLCLVLPNEVCISWSKILQNFGMNYFIIRVLELIILIGSIIILFKSIKSEKKVVIFGLTTAICAIFPISLKGLAEPYAWYLYIASIGIIPLLISITFSIYNRGIIKKFAFIILILFCVSSILGTLTIQARVKKQAGCYQVLKKALQTSCAPYMIQTTNTGFPFLKEAFMTLCPNVKSMPVIKTVNDPELSANIKKEKPDTILWLPTGHYLVFWSKSHL